jgi:WD40 repeat protein
LTEDGLRAVSASWDNTLRVWDVDSGRLLHTLESCRLFYTASTLFSDTIHEVTLSRDGRHVLSAAMDHTLRVWDLIHGAEIAIFTCDAPVSCCAFIEARRIVACDYLGRLHWLELVE